MSVRIKIDVVSDISCPWCAIGLNALEAALGKLAPEVQAELHFQPFELNPQMGAAGESIAEHLGKKYGTTPEQILKNEETIRTRGEQVGFKFDMGKRTRIYNTFDAHRLLCWADAQGKQRALKHALFVAYFTEGRDPGDHEVLAEVAAQLGLDAQRARQILASDEYASEVRARERFFLDRGIKAVPAVIVNDRYLIQGGQPVEVFEQALRRIAAETPARPQPAVGK
jgi:predicted DsbA family dithiol-disulfide isomerase